MGDTVYGRERMVQALLEAIPDLVFRLGKDGRFLGFLSAKGQPPALPPADFLGKSVRDVLPPELALWTMRYVKEALETGDTRSFEYQLPVPLPDGDLRHFEARLVVSGEDEVLVIARDITDRKKAEGALRQSEQRLREVLETSRDITYRMNPATGVFDYISPAVQELTGFSAEEATAAGLEGFTRRLHPVDQRQFEVESENLLSGAGEAAVLPPVEYRWKCKNGEYRWHSNSWVLVRDEHGAPVAIVGTVRDVTEQKRTQEAAKESEAKWRSLVENAPALIMVVRDDGTIEFANRGVPGAPAEEAIGRTIYDYAPAEYHDDIRDVFAWVLETGESGGDFDVPWLEPGGNLSWYSARVGPMKRDGEVVALTVIAIDITKRKRAEEALRESEQKYRRVVGDSIDGITIAQGLDVKFVNRALVEMLGYGSEEEMLGRPLTDFISPEYQELGAERAVVRQSGGRAPERQELKLMRKDGTEFPVEVSVGMVMYDGSAASQAIVRDITERKRAEEALRESEERFRDIASGVSEWIAEVNAEGSYVYTNPVVQQILGYAPEEVVGRKVLDFLHPDDLKRSVLQFQDSLDREEGLRGFVTRMIHRDGSVRDVEISANLILDEGGNVAGLRGITHDITERKRAEEALRESEERLREVLEVSRAYVYRHNLETGRYDYVSPAVTQVIGFTPEELIEMGFEEAEKRTHPEDLPHHRAHLEGLLRRPSQAIAAPPIEYRWRCKDGKYCWLSDNRAVIRDDNGWPIARVGTIRDITKRRQAEEAMREYEQRSREILEASRDLIYKLDVEARKFEYLSPAVQRLTGFTPRELIGMGFDGVAARIHPQDQPAFKTSPEELPACLGEDRAISAVEYRWRCKDGKYRWLSNSWVLLRGDKGQPAALVGAMRDITERKRTEEALQRAREELEARVEERMDGGNSYRLTFRELTVLHLVAAGRADKEIAVELGIRPRTVSKHLENILRKMSADSRTEAGVRALREGLVG